MFALIATSERGRRGLLQVGVGLLVAAIVVPLVLPGSVVGRALSTLVGSTSGLSSNGRSQLWSQALTAFGQHPLLGVGTGGFGSINPEEQYPHNILLENAVELGLVGLVLVGGIILSTASRLANVWRAASGRDRLEGTVIVTLFIMALVNALVSGAIQDNGELWVWGGLGLGLGARLAAEHRSAATWRRSSLPEIARDQARSAPGAA